MSEKFSPVKDERDELAELEAKLAKKRNEVEAKENFGKYDYTVPAEGEHTYSTYMDERPDDGVLREGDKFRNAKSGEFASFEDYQASLESNEDYYNRQFERDTEGEKKYEDMSLIELAKKLGENDDDRSISGEIMHVLGEKIDAMAVKYNWDADQKASHSDALFEIAFKAKAAQEKATAETEDKLDPADRENIDKIREFINNNPDSPETSRLVDELKEVMRQINEALNASRTADNLDDLGDLPGTKGSGDSLDDLDDIDTPRDPREANYVDKDTALKEAYDEYATPERGGEAYDVDKGREKDVEKAHEDAIAEYGTAERGGEAYDVDKGRVKDIDEAHDLALEENAERSGTRVEDINEAWDQAHAEDAERTRAGKWYRRAWRRFNFAFTPLGRQQLLERAAEQKDKFKDSKTSTKIAIGVVAATAVTIAAYGAWKAGAFDMFSGDNTPDGTPDADATTKPEVKPEVKPEIKPEVPPVVPGAELPPSTGFEYPWDWAVDAFGSENAMDKLHELADLAAEDGKNVEWHGDGAREWVEINGNSNTKDVIDILRTYNR